MKNSIITTLRALSSCDHDIGPNAKERTQPEAIQVITARIWRMREGTVSVCLSVHTSTGGGVPSQVWMVVGGGTLARSGWWGVPQSGLDGGGVPQSGLDGGGIPQSGLDGGGVPRPGLDGGGYPSQVWMVGEYPSQVWMVGEYPGQVWMVGGTPARSGWWGVPWSGLDGGGVPRVPSGQVWMVVGGTQGTPLPIRQSSIASTCYPADSIPPAWTQEDFLVHINFWLNINHINYPS